MENNMDKVINELEDESLEAVTGGVGEDDGKSFECIIGFMSGRGCVTVEIGLHMLCNTLSMTRYYSHYEIYHVEDSIYGSDVYKVVATPAENFTLMYNSFDKLVHDIDGIVVISMRTL